jgi:aspartate beta-hydroxylase
MTSAAEAQQLMRQGRFAEAERAYAAVLEQSPDHVEALNVLGLGALRDGQPQRALELLSRAVAANPGDAMSQHHLARVHEAFGNVVAATVAQRRAVELRPEFFVARLHLGALLERSGEHRAALVQYARALRDAQSKGRWINPSTTPEPLRPLVEHAVITFRRDRRALFFDLLEPLAQRYGREALTRVEKCLRIYLGEEPAAYPDSRQQPTFLYFPDLPTTPYFDRALFPWIADIEALTATIRDELLALLSSDDGRERVFTSDELEQAHLRGLRGKPTWDGYYFYRHGERREDNCAACPRTAAALDALPLCRVREHAPETFFSVFTPGTHLLPHRGVTNTRIVAHLPLMVPEDCALSVGGEDHAWQEGRIVVFDDTFEHEAWNRSDRSRVVLIFDLWNPYLTEAERAAVTDLVPAIGDLRKSIDAA